LYTSKQRRHVKLHNIIFFVLFAYRRYVKHGNTHIHRHECYREVTSFEQASNTTFDAVVKVRPDVAWFFPVKTAMELLHDRPTLVTHLTDQFIFSPRRYAHGFREFWDNYTACDSGAWNGAHIPELAYKDAFEHQGISFYYDDKKTPQVIRRFSKHEPSAAVACRRQRRITNETRCLELVYDFDDAYD